MIAHFSVANNGPSASAHTFQFSCIVHRKLCLITLLLLSACGGQPTENTNGSGNSTSSSSSSGGPPTTVSQNPKYEQGTPVVRRLTKTEYFYTIKDLFNLTLTDDQRDLLPAEKDLAGFRNSASTQTVAAKHAESYRELAGIIVEKIDFERFLQQHAACRQGKKADSNCEQSFIQSAASTIFRRPPDQTEFLSLDKVSQASHEAGFDFEQRAKSVTKAMLQFPGFLYRLELEKKSENQQSSRTLNAYEIATRLSYFLWSSTPDDQLLAAAKNGRLQSKEEIIFQTNRMLKDIDKSQRSTNRFVWDWLRLAIVSEEDTPLRDALINQFQHQIWHENKTLFSLLTSQEMHLPRTWAEEAGLNQAIKDTANDAFPRYNTSSHPGLVGLFAHPASLQAMISSAETEYPFIHRGLYLHERLFCGNQIPNPPETLRVAIDDFSDSLAEGISQRDEADQRVAFPQCGFCHHLFEPLAYPYEPYDSKAHFQTRDHHGNSVRTDGILYTKITGAEEKVNYRNMLEFMEGVSTTPNVKRCIMEKHLQFALGRKLEDQEKPATQEVLEALELTDGTYSDLVRAIVTHKSFTEVAVQ